MSKFKRLTPDPAEWIIQASRAADRIATMSNELGGRLDELERNLTAIQQHGLKAEKLDYCVRRIGRIRFMLNAMELGCFTGISVKNTCEELYRKLP